MTTTQQTADAPTELRPQPAGSGRVIAVAERFGLVALFAAVLIVFSVLPSTSATFPTADNFANITGNQSVLALIALGAIVPLICGEFDISVGPIVALTSVISAYAVSAWEVSLVVAVLLGIACGGAVGLVNGLLVGRTGLNSLISTLAVGTVLMGLTAAISSTPIISGIPEDLTSFGTGDWLGVPRPFFVLVAVALVLAYVLGQTPRGRELHAIGSNPVAARLVGVPVQRRVTWAFVVSGLVCGAAGVLQLARSGVGDPNLGMSFTLPAVAAAFLGATTIRPGRFNVLGTIVAVMFLAAVVSGLTIMGAQAWLQHVVNGGALLAGIAISTVIARHRAGSA